MDLLHPFPLGFATHHRPIIFISTLKSSFIIFMSESHRINYEQKLALKKEHQRLTEEERAKLKQLETGLEAQRQAVEELKEVIEKKR
jgi:hypothetical protein